MVFGNYHIWMGELIFWHLGCWCFIVCCVFWKQSWAFRQKQQRDSSLAQRLRRSFEDSFILCSKKQMAPQRVTPLKATQIPCQKLIRLRLPIKKKCWIQCSGVFFFTSRNFRKEARPLPSSGGFKGVQKNIAIFPCFLLNKQMPVCDLSVARSPQEIPQHATLREEKLSRCVGPPPRMLNLPVRLVLLKYVGQGARVFACFLLGQFLVGWISVAKEFRKTRLKYMVYHFLAPIKIPKAIRFKQSGGNLEKSATDFSPKLPKPIHQASLGAASLLE